MHIIVYNNLIRVFKMRYKQFEVKEIVCVCVHSICSRLRFSEIFSAVDRLSAGDSRGKVQQILGSPKLYFQKNPSAFSVKTNKGGKYRREREAAAERARGLPLRENGPKY